MLGHRGGRGPCGVLLWCYVCREVPLPNSSGAHGEGYPYVTISGSRAQQLGMGTAGMRHCHCKSDELVLLQMDLSALVSSDTDLSPSVSPWAGEATTHLA